MSITIIKGNIDYIRDCEEALVDSELGNRYFSGTGSARQSLESGFRKEEIYVAIDNTDHCIGFVWVIPNGSFHSFPYIHIIAVKSTNRGQGIGKMLLKFVEDVYFKDSSKLFLVVADFNPDAKRLYESIGYTAIGDIPNLYRNGITECLMMKARESAACSNLKSESLSTLPNIGKDTELQLNQIGIYSYKELCNLGAEQAWLKLQEIDESACINRLLALEGAIQGVKKTMLPEARKKALTEFYSWHKK